MFVKCHTELAAIEARHVLFDAEVSYVEEERRRHNRWGAVLRVLQELDEPTTQRLRAIYGAEVGY